MKKIVFVTGTIRGITSWPYLFAQGLSMNGMDVTVISGFANINVSEDCRKHDLANPYEEISPTFRIVRVGSRRRDSSNLALRALKYVGLTNSLCHEVKKHQADYYIYYSTPPFLGLIGRKQSKLGKKTIYIAQDIFPDSLFSIKPFLSKTFIGSALSWMERLIYDGNSRIITISETMADNIRKKKKTKDCINVISNWANVDTLSHVYREYNPLFDEYGIDRRKFIVSYAGSLGPLQNLDVLLDVAKHLSECKDIEFVIFGRGVSYDALMKRISDEGIENVKLFPSQPLEKISAVYSLGNIEYVSVGTGVMNMACPHKIFDIFAVGNPILAAIDSDSEMAKIISQKDLGYVVEAKELSIRNAVLKAYKEDRSELRRMGENARQYAESIDYNSQIRKYVNLISGC